MFELNDSILSAKVFDLNKDVNKRKQRDANKIWLRLFFINIFGGRDRS